MPPRKTKQVITLIPPLSFTSSITQIKPSSDLTDPETIIKQIKQKEQEEKQKHKEDTHLEHKLMTSVKRKYKKTRAKNTNLNEQTGGADRDANVEIVQQNQKIKENTNLNEQTGGADGDVNVEIVQQNQKIKENTNFNEQTGGGDGDVNVEIVQQFQKIKEDIDLNEQTEGGDGNVNVETVQQVQKIKEDTNQMRPIDIPDVGKAPRLAFVMTPPVIRGEEDSNLRAQLLRGLVKVADTNPQLAVKLFTAADSSILKSWFAQLEPIWNPEILPDVSG